MPVIFSIPNLMPIFGLGLLFVLIKLIVWCGGGWVTHICENAATSTVHAPPPKYYLLFFFFIPAIDIAIATACLRFLTMGAFFGPLGLIPPWSFPAPYSFITLPIFFCCADFFILFLWLMLLYLSATLHPKVLRHIECANTCVTGLSHGGTCSCRSSKSKGFHRCQQCILHGGCVC